MRLSSALLKILIKIRYRINISGLELLDTPWSKLILPTHVALMDPIIMFAFLSRKKKINPVVTESYYKKPVLKWMFDMVWAIPVADLTLDKNKTLDTDAIVWNITNALKNDHNVLLYPQWALARQWFQSITWKKTAFYAAKQAPESSRLLTVNIRWLRWSRSSWARNGKSPNLLLFLVKGLWFTILNLLFFVPKRTVEIEIKDSTDKLLKSSEKWIDSFNQELEKIYNAKWEEKVNYLSGLCWYNTTKHHKAPEKIIWSIEDLKTTTSANVDVPEDVLNKITSVIKKIKPDYAWKITTSTNLVLDCFFDSLDMAELKSSVQSIFPDSSNPPLLDLKTVWDVALMAIWKSATNEELKPCDWQYKRDSKAIYTHLKPIIKEDSTILSVMKESLSRDLDDSFFYDSIFWVQSRKDFLIKAYLIADLLKKVPWDRVAIMLPSLSATLLLITWCYLAKKVPVMLNWTQSSEAFSHCLKTQNVRAILTAKSFFQQIQTPWLKRHNVVFFEDLLKKISLRQKLMAVYRAKKFKIPSDISDIAVVLFTSWSEALPKTVELTHKNILQDLLWAAWMISWITMDNVEICFLPPFHSFWFILGIALPLVSWMRIVFTPDPNDSKTIANLIEHTKSNVVASTPTFLSWIVQIAKEKQLDSLQIAIVWAEKCPKELFTKFSKKSPNATIIEWYWITECSPIIAVNPFKRNAKIKRWTVWLPILWEKIKILELETNNELWPNQEWMIFVNWYNIFSWYIDKKLESPFLEINWEKWYQTWDLWFFDKDGYLTISWRLKRFVKIAWEMISLPAVESVLSRKWKSDTWLETLALESEEKNWNVKLTLFTVDSLTTKEVNAYLREQWVSNLVSIDSIIKLEEIPMLWTWKVDHVQLKGLLQSSWKPSKK